MLSKWRPHSGLQVMELGREILRRSAYNLSINCRASDFLDSMLRRGRVTASKKLHVVNFTLRYVSRVLAVLNEEFDLAWVARDSLKVKEPASSSTTTGSTQSSSSGIELPLSTRRWSHFNGNRRNYT